jgi:hypothetical protein
VRLREELVPQPFSVDLLYGDHEGGQHGRPTIKGFESTTGGTKNG